MAGKKYLLKRNTICSLSVQVQSVKPLSTSHGAKQCHRPALVHPDASVAETQLHHAAKTHRHRRGRCHAAPPANLHPPSSLKPLSPGAHHLQQPFPVNPSLPRRRLHGGYDTHGAAAAAQSKADFGLPSGRGSGVDRRDLDCASKEENDIERRHHCWASRPKFPPVPILQYLSLLLQIRQPRAAINRNLQGR